MIGSYKAKGNARYYIWRMFQRCWSAILSGVYKTQSNPQANRVIA
jgi:hypothetical protein